MHLVFPLQRALRVSLLGACQAWGDESRDEHICVCICNGYRKRLQNSTSLSSCGLMKSRICGFGEESLSTFLRFKARCKTWTQHGLCGAAWTLWASQGWWDRNTGAVMCRHKFIRLRWCYNLLLLEQHLIGWIELQKSCKVQRENLAAKMSGERKSKQWAEWDSPVWML